MNIDLNTIKWLINEREAIRLGKTTKNNVLLNSRFENIFRQDDKTTKWIFDNCKTIEQVLIARLINRIDLLEIWKEGTPGEPFSTSHFLSVSPVVTNSKAYSFYPRKGETIRDIFTDIEKNKDFITFCLEMDSSAGTSIKDLALHLSKEINRPLHFYFSMVILDCAQMKLIDPKILDTEMYEGPGTIKTFKALGMTATELAKELNVKPFEAENIACITRKFVDRTNNGIPNNRKR